MNAPLADIRNRHLPPSFYGEVTQWGTSNHDWLESRGDHVRHLVLMIDVATGRSSGGFVPCNNTSENMRVLWNYLERYGRMANVYAFPNSLFAVAHTRRAIGSTPGKAERVTQIGRALRELGIGLITVCPPTDGRDDCWVRTDQDRLIKSLRLARVNTMQAANEFLEREYWPEWNERFARPSSELTDLHRPVTAKLELSSILSHVEERAIADDYTFLFRRRRYQIARPGPFSDMKDRQLRVELRLDGSLQACYEGRKLRISSCDQRERIAVIPSAAKRPREGPNAGGKSGWMQGFSMARRKSR